MQPYRTAAPPPDQTSVGAPAEEWVVAAVLGIVGVARVTVALVGGEELGVDVTVAGLVAAIGIVLLAQLCVDTRSSCTSRAPR